MAVMLFHFVLVIFFDCAPKYSACSAPAIQNDSVFETLVPCSYYQGVVLSAYSGVSSAPMKHQRLQPELFQACTDITGVVGTITTFAHADINKEILKLWV